MFSIKNATISTGNENDTELVHILVDDGRIADVVPASSGDVGGDDEIDAKGLLVLPGAIDPHVHFDTPGYTDREDFTHGSMTAASGGVTCVIDMPDTSVPPVIDGASLRTKLSAIENMSVIDFALWGGMSGNSFHKKDWQQRLKQLKKAGVVGIKCYLLSGMRTFEHLFPQELVVVMQEARELGLLMGLHAEDRDLASKRMAALKTAGRFDPKAYYECKCDPVELHGIEQGIAAAEGTGCSLHIVHVGSGKGADAAVKAKRGGADITMETCIHFLAFSFHDLVERGAVVKTAPVVKTKRDSEMLWKLLAKGGIDFLASDHAPCPDSEKNTGSIWTDYAGMPGAGLMFPYAFSEGFKRGSLTLARLVEVTSTNAAKRYGLHPRKGSFEKGADADLIFIDPDARWTVEGAKFYSKGKLTPFEGYEFTGKVMRTMCRGDVVYEDGRGIVAEPGYGEFVRRGY